MKTLLPIPLLLISVALNAQHPLVTVSVNAGRSIGTSTLKQDALMGDGTQFGADVFVPLLRKGWDGSVKGSGKFALGIVAGGSYMSAKNVRPATAALYENYKLYAGQLNISNGEYSSSAVSTFSAGAQSDFTWGKMSLSPSISAGYINIHRETVTQVSMVPVNGDLRQVTLSASPKVKEQGLLITPQIKMGYLLTRNFGVYAAGAVNAGPATTHTQHYLVPSGGFNDKKTYEALQLAEGRMSGEGVTKKTPYLATVIRVGFSWSISSGKTKNLRKGSGAASASYAATGKMAQSDTGAIRSGATSASYAATGKMVQSDTGAIRGGATSASYASTGRMVQSDTGAIRGGATSVSYAATGKMARSDTGAIRGGATSSSYAATGKMVQSDTGAIRGGATSASYAATGRMINPGANGRQAPNTTFGAKVTQALPGNPIGGIIIHGAKSTGGKQIVVTTDANGQFNFQIKKAGNYRFVLTAPQGLKKSDNPLYNGQGQTGNNPIHHSAAITGNPLYEEPAHTGVNPLAARTSTPGQPIGGIVVKGGKNPGGSMITRTTNPNGEIYLDQLTKGKYRFVVTTP